MSSLSAFNRCVAIAAALCLSSGAANSSPGELSVVATPASVIKKLTEPVDHDRRMKMKDELAELIFTLEIGNNTSNEVLLKPRRDVLVQLVRCDDKTLYDVNVDYDGFTELVNSPSTAIAAHGVLRVLMSAANSALVEMPRATKTCTISFVVADSRPPHKLLESNTVTIHVVH